jgi:hypothetical protein
MSLRSFFFMRRHMKACRDLARDVERTKRSGASASPTGPLGLRPEPQEGLGHSASVPLRGAL